MKAMEIMTRDVISLDENTVITEAIAKMRDNSVHTVLFMYNHRVINH